MSYPHLCCLSLSSLAQTEGAALLFSAHSFLFHSFWLFWLLWTIGLVVVVVVVVMHSQVSECFWVLQEVNGPSSISITCLCSCTVASISCFILREEKVSIIPQFVYLETKIYFTSEAHSCRFEATTNLESHLNFQYICIFYFLVHV